MRDQDIMWRAQFHSRQMVVVLILIASLSVWLRMAYPPLGIWGSHDDALFVRMATSILHGEWLGPYDALVLAKGAAFPFFLAINKMTGLPLKLTEHLLYLVVAWLAASLLARVFHCKALLPIAFLVLALSPVPWMTEGGARVTREPLYQVLTVALVVSAMAHFRSGHTSYLGGAVLGFLGGAFWLTREEGIWLAAAIAIIAMPWAYRVLRSTQSEPGIRTSGALAALVVPVAAFAVIVMFVNSANWFTYGVFRNNDLRSGPFAEAYGALARINHDEWKRYVVWPKDARLRAYSISPSAKELGSYFEGGPGQHWVKAAHDYPSPWGCVGVPAACNTEILAPWLVWALRDAVSIAGHYRSAMEADAYYRQLAEEINAGCDAGRIACRERRGTLAPVWRGHYLRDTLRAGTGVMTMLVTLNQGRIGVIPSPLTDEQARVFHDAINDDVNGFGRFAPNVAKSPGPAEQFREAVTHLVASAYSTFLPALSFLALLSYVYATWCWRRVKSAAVSSDTIILLTALLAAVTARVGLLAFLEATSIPSNSIFYLLPAVPLHLLFVVASIAAGVTAVQRSLCERGA